jgi:hypothetical protein
MNGTQSMAITSFTENKISSCLFNAFASDFAYYTANTTNPIFPTKDIHLEVYAGYSLASLSATTVNYFYGIRVFNTISFGGGICPDKNLLAKLEVAGTTTRASGDTCKTYVIERTLNVTGTSINVCPLCYHGNVLYDGFSAFTAKITPVWSA